MKQKDSNSTAIFNVPNLTEASLEEIDLSRATKIVIDAYHQAGYYGGEFENSEFVVNGDNIVLDSPEYTRFMLYGRGPGKMPPIEPIAGWCAKQGIDISPWAIAKSIAKKGTKGNDFLSPVVPTLASYFAIQIGNLIGSEMTEE